MSSIDGLTTNESEGEDTRTRLDRYISRFSGSELVENLELAVLKPNRQSDKFTEADLSKVCKITSAKKIRFDRS